MLIPLIYDIHRRKKVVRILDFGGGFGDNFLHIIKNVPDYIQEVMEWHIIDTPYNCEKGEELFSDFDKKIIFSKANPEHASEYEEGKLGNSYDILLLSGTLQYVDQWESFIGKLTEFSAKYFYITRTPFIESVGTFCTLQRICPGIGKYKDCYLGDIAITIINEKELMEMMSNKGYGLCLGLSMGSYSDAMCKLPEPYNQSYYKHLLFCNRMRD